MKQQDFFEILASMLETDPELVKAEVRLQDLPGWDSMAVISFMALADSELGAVVSGKDMAKCETVGDLVKLFPGKLVD